VGLIEVLFPRRFREVPTVTLSAAPTAAGAAAKPPPPAITVVQSHRRGFTVSVNLDDDDGAAGGSGSGSTGGGVAELPPMVQVGWEASGDPEVRTDDLVFQRRITQCQQWLADMQALHRIGQGCSLGIGAVGGGGGADGGAGEPKEEPNCYLLELEEDLLEIIVSHLCSHTDIVSLGATCPQMEKVREVIFSAPSLF
jgi:hypothetical protein